MSVVGGIDIGIKQVTDMRVPGERQRHRQSVTRVFSTAIDAALQLDNPAVALLLATRLTALDPFVESVHRQTISAYEQSGDRP